MKANNKRRGQSIVFLSGCGVLLLLCISAIGFYAWGVQPERQPGCPYLRLGLRDKCEYDRTFTAESLFVDSTFFPFEVEIIPFEGSLGRHGTVERVIASVYSTDGEILGGHELRRSVGSEQAARDYQGTTELYIIPGEKVSLSPCGIPHNLDYQSPLADQFCAACSVGDHCQSVGQYQDYVSIFWLDIESAGLTQADFIAILSRLDERMAQYLELED